jgi:hypothetical protein
MQFGSCIRGGILVRMTEDATTPPASTLDQWANFWRYQIGVNVIPANSKNKQVHTRWAEWQDKPVPEELHKQWKQQHAFSQGIAIIPGKV